jgi:hypothetical protein
MGPPFFARQMLAHDWPTDLVITRRFCRLGTIRSGTIPREGIPDALPVLCRPLPFRFRFTWRRARFTNPLEPDACSRHHTDHPRSIAGRRARKRRLHSQGAPPVAERFAPLEFPASAHWEQRRIVNANRDASAQLARLQDQFVASLQKGGNLRRAVLAHAFSGRLVPQSVYDEPASGFLERIQSHRKGSSHANSVLRGAKELAHA